MDLLDFTCPRCSQTVQGRFYGPCDGCRAQLKAALGGEAREIQTEAFEPKMHVVPNHVATKD